jgi:hypothetical protein
MPSTGCLGYNQNPTEVEHLQVQGENHPKTVQIFEAEGSIMLLGIVATSKRRTNASKYYEYGCPFHHAHKAEIVG